MSDQWFDMLNSHVCETFAEIHMNPEQLILPGCAPQLFVL